MRSVKKIAALPAVAALALALTACQDNSVETAPADPAPAPTQDGGAPTQEPTQAPTEEPTAEPTEEPTQEPTEEPTKDEKKDDKKDDKGSKKDDKKDDKKGGGKTVSEGQAAFGDTWAYDDGLSITVSKPDDSFEPSSTASSDGFEKFVAFEVTITNNTGEKYDPSFMLFDIQSGGREGKQIYDFGQDDGTEYTNGPSGTLLDGKSISYNVAFGVEDPKDLVLELTPDLDRNDDDLPTWVQ